MKNKKKIISITIVVIALIVCISALTLALWTKSFEQTGTSRNQYDCFTINYSDNIQDVVQSGGVPQTDGEGVENDPFVITITNTCNTIGNYEVLMHKAETSNMLDDSYLKLSVDGTIMKYSEAKATTKRSIESNTSIDPITVNESKIISSGVIGPKGTRKINVRTWMDENTTRDQGSGKTFNYKITVESSAGNNLKLLAGTILEQEVKTGNIDFTKGEPPSSGGESTTGSGLFSAEDDDGTSYYFRGDKTLINNYVHFADQYWRIVRINGDGTIRLILDDNIGDYYFNSSSNERKYVGYTYDNDACTLNSPCWSSHTSSNGSFTNSHNGSNSTIKTQLETWYNSNLSGNDSKIAYGTYCNDTSYGSESDDNSSYYGAFERLSPNGSKYVNPTLTCPDPTDANGQMRTYGGVYKLKIGLLTADEMNYAGLRYYGGSATSNNYLYKSYGWWSLSPFNSSSYVSVFSGNYGDLINGSVDNTNGVRPVINLTTDTLTTTGDGSANTPYEVQ